MGWTEPWPAPGFLIFFFIGILFSGGFKPPLNRLHNITAFWFAGVLNPLYFGRPEFLNAFYFTGVSNPLYFEVDILNLQDY